METRGHACKRVALASRRDCIWRGTGAAVVDGRSLAHRSSYYIPVSKFGVSTDGGAGLDSVQDRRIVLGMVLIVAGGAVLAWPTGEESASDMGPLALAGASLAWAIDNNLTRKVSGVEGSAQARSECWK